MLDWLHSFMMNEAKSYFQGVSYADLVFLEISINSYKLHTLNRYNFDPRREANSCIIDNYFGEI